MTLRRLYPLVAALVLTAATGCLTSTEPDAGQAFDLALGAATDVDTSLHVRFADVANESRCPKGVQCIWAGDAVVRLALTQGRDSASVELHANAGAGPARVDFGSYTVELLQLAPYPEHDQPIDRSKYTATLRATRR